MTQFFWAVYQVVDNYIIVIFATYDYIPIWVKDVTLQEWRCVYEWIIYVLSKF